MWKMLISGGWMAIPCMIATISIMNLVSVNPKQKKLEKIQAENNIQAMQLKTFEAEVLDYAQTVKAQVQKMKEDSVNYAEMTAQKQNVIAGLNGKVKTKDALITNLKTGIQVDLVKLTYKDGLFSKPKLVDSVYVEGIRYGGLLRLNAAE